jgi:hypothetical protein
MGRDFKAFPWALALVCGFGWVRSARAYEEQASLDGAAGVAIVPHAETLSPVGTELSLGGTLGVSDMFLARAQLGYAALFDNGSAQHVGRARAEFAYLLDVLQVVPFFGVGANLWLYEADDAVRARPGVHLLVGVDYLWSRAWTFGLDVRPGLVLEPDRVTSSTEIQLRVSRMFDLF